MNASIDITGLVLETKRLILREWIESDLDDLFEYASVPGVGEMAGWPHHENKDISKEILNLFINDKKTFAVVYKENNKVIGSLGIEEYNEKENLEELSNYKGREIGYVLSKDYWGMGLMPEAVFCVIDYLFNNLNLDFLICTNFKYNSQSARVKEKCGFIPYRNVLFTKSDGEKIEGVLSVLKNPKKEC